MGLEWMKAIQPATGTSFLAPHGGRQRGDRGDRAPSQYAESVLFFKLEKANAEAEK